MGGSAAHPGQCPCPDTLPRANKDPEAAWGPSFTDMGACRGKSALCVGMQVMGPWTWVSRLACHHRPVACHSSSGLRSWGRPVRPYILKIVTQCSGLRVPKKAKRRETLDSRQNRLQKTSCNKCAGSVRSRRAIPVSPEVPPASGVGQRTSYECHTPPTPLPRAGPPVV